MHAYLRTLYPWCSPSCASCVITYTSYLCCLVVFFIRKLWNVVRKKEELPRHLSQLRRAHHLPSPKTFDPHGHQLEEQAHRSHPALHQVARRVRQLFLRLADRCQEGPRFLLQSPAYHLRCNRPEVRHRLVVVAPAAPHPDLTHHPQLQQFPDLNARVPFARAHLVGNLVERQRTGTEIQHGEDLACRLRQHAGAAGSIAQRLCYAVAPCTHRLELAERSALILPNKLRLGQAPAAARHLTTHPRTGTPYQV